jgi:hypothetical protein
MSLLAWTDAFVVPYLANQIFKIETGSYVNGELSHREKGLYENYAECFRLSSPFSVIQLLKYLVEDNWLNQNEHCFCGSKRKYKNCFLKNRADHQLGIPIYVLRKDLESLKRYY